MELRNDHAIQSLSPQGGMAGYAGMTLSNGKPFDTKGPADERQIDALLQGMLVLARGIACTRDSQRFLVQHEGAIFNFCLDKGGQISHSAVVHPLRFGESDFLAADGMPPVFLRIAAARQVLETHLGVQPDLPAPGGARPED